MNLKHNFLLAMPGLGGDYFANTLTYICEHNKDGAMGIIINRPSDMSLTELLAQVGLPANQKLLDTNVYQGGPVAVERGMVLHTSNRTFDSSADLGAGLCLSTAMEVLAAIANDEGPEQYLVALGYAGWDEGQLEDEIASNVWLTAPADQRVLFKSAWQDKLTDAAELLGINLNLIAAKPGHA